MSRQNLPANQQRHDNVSAVRLKAGGCRFEIACYRNKVQSYRNGVEKDIEEVLQIERVFTNVTQGMFTKIEDVRKHLGPKIPKSKTMNDLELERAACLLILDTGMLQLNEKERHAEVDGILNDIATFIAEKTVHPETRRPYPPTMVHSALNTLGFTPNTRKPAKTQALEAIKQLSSSGVLALERAPMLLKAVLTQGSYEECLNKIREVPGVTVRAASFEAATVEFLIPPEAYRTIDSIVTNRAKKCSLQVLASSVAQDGEVKLDTSSPKRGGEREKELEAEEQVEDKPSISKTAQKKAKRRGKKAGDELEPQLGGKLLAIDDSDEGDSKGKKKKKGKKRTAEPKEKVVAKKQEESDSDDFLTGKKKLQKEREEREKKRKDELLRSDPNYYDSDEFGSDYSDFYENEDEDLDINQIHALKEAKKKKQAEEEQLKKEEEEKAKPKTRGMAKKKRKQRNKKGEIIESDEEEED